MTSDRFDEIPDGDRDALNSTISRRSMLRWGGIAGASLLTSACGGGGSSGSSGSGSTSGAVTIPTTPSTGALQPVTPTPTPTQTPAPSPTATKTEFGVNYYDIFHRFITNAAPFNPEDQLKGLSDRNIKVVRFVACPQFARDWKLWNANPDRYLGALERVFAAGDKYGMKLVPILMSAPYGLSDLNGEAFAAWGNPSSATRRAFDAWIPPMVRRFNAHSSILMWEKANEMNAFANNPQGYKYYPPVDTVLNTVRTAADNYTDADVCSAYARFGELVRSEDTVRPFQSGSTLPNAAETRRGAGKAGKDDRDEFRTALIKTLSGGSKMLSVHLYDDICSDRFEKGSNFNEVASIVRSVADSQGAKLFVGEWGVPKGTNPDADRTRFTQMLAELKANKPDYACLWGYDHIYSDWNVSTPERSWMIDAIAAENG